LSILSITHILFVAIMLCNKKSVTGEHTCMLLNPLATDDIEVNGSDELGFFGPYYRAFRSSFTKLLCSPRFNTMDYKLVMSIFSPQLNFIDVEPSSSISHGISDDILNSPISMRRLEAYVNKYADHHPVIEFGDSYKAPANVATAGSASDGTGKKKGRTVTLTADDMQKRKNDVKARTTLLLSLPDDHQLRFKEIRVKLPEYGIYSSAKHNSGNEEVNIASGSTASINVSTASANIGVASISQDTACQLSRVCVGGSDEGRGEECGVVKVAGRYGREGFQEWREELCIA
nr:RNA cytidine acetyltransferase 1-like [Tanacetum cinerariifolium]